MLRGIRRGVFIYRVATISSPKEDERERENRRSGRPSRSFYISHGLRDKGMLQVDPDFFLRLADIRYT